jgi:hypothetical protein
MVVEVRPRDGGRGGPAGAAAIRGAWTRLPKVLACSIMRFPRDTACWTAISAPRDAAGDRAATTPPTIAAQLPLTRKLESSPPSPLYGIVAGLVIYK